MQIKILIMQKISRTTNVFIQKFAYIYSLTNLATLFAFTSKASRRNFFHLNKHKKNFLLHYFKFNHSSFITRTYLKFLACFSLYKETADVWNK